MGSGFTEVLSQRLEERANSVSSSTPILDDLTVWTRWLQDQSKAFEKRTADVESQFEVFRELEAHMNRRYASLEEEVARLKTVGPENEALKTAFEDHKIELAVVQKAAEQSEFNLKAAQDQISDLNNALANSKQEIDMLRRLIDARDTRSQAEEQALLRREERLEKQEARLRNYIANMETEKSQIKRITSELGEEIQAAQVMNPLKDYLSLTEFELSKIELQLKKTPTLSQDRPKLEACLTKLMEQREFLRATLQASQEQLHERAAALKRLTQDTSLELAPPLPPRVAYSHSLHFTT